MSWLLLLIACGGDPSPAPAPPSEAGPPDLLLVTIDTLRADRVGVYGDPLAKTPTLDALAAEGALFRQAHSVTPLTLPSHASMLTGALPRVHALRDNGGFRLATHVPTIAETLLESGYATGAFVSAFVLDGAWGLDRGFQEYRDPFHPQEVGKVGAFGEVELSSAEVINAAAAWWRQNDDQPRFAWVHLYDPHTPWKSHSGWTGDPYRGEVAWTDELLGRLVRAVGDETTIIVTSDHGEGLWEGGEREHGVLLGTAVTRVPLIVRSPRVTQGKNPAPRPALATDVRRPDGVDSALDMTPVPDDPGPALRVVESPVSGVDIAPTLAALAGIDDFSADGRSLVPALSGQALAERPVYAETFFPLFHHGWAPLTMAQDAQVRVELGARATARDLQDGSDVPPPEPLLAFITASRGADTPAPGPISADAAAGLEALGYITRAAPERDQDTDPRDQMDALAALAAAESLPAADAVPRLEALCAAEPGMVDARIALSLARAELGDIDGALEDTRAVLRAWPDHPTALANGAALARQLGKPDEALAIARHMQTINAMDPRGWRIEAAIQVDREDADAVLAATVAGLKAAPDDPNLHYLRALAELQIGDPIVAAEHLQSAREHGSQAGDIDLWLGMSFERAGQLDAALGHYDNATRTMQRDPRPWAAAGWMLYKAGRCPEARPYLINVARRGGGKDARVQQAMQACDPANLTQPAQGG